MSDFLKLFKQNTRLLVCRMMVLVGQIFQNLKFSLTFWVFLFEFSKFFSSELENVIRWTDTDQLTSKLEPFSWLFNRSRSSRLTAVNRFRSVFTNTCSAGFRVRKLSKLSVAIEQSCINFLTLIKYVELRVSEYKKFITKIYFELTFRRQHPPFRIFSHSGA